MRTRRRCRGRNLARKPDFVINLGKANHVSATPTAVAVEQAFAGVNHEARMMILMQWAQSHPSAAAELPYRPPIMCLEIIPNWNLPLQLVECVASHGLSCLERQNTAQRAQIPGKDGGAWQKLLILAAAPAPHTQQPPPAPSKYGGWIGQARGVSTVRRCLLGNDAGADSVACLLATPQSEMRERNRAIPARW